MATAESANDFYLWFYLNLKSREDASSKTVLITNRYLKDVPLSDSDAEHYPIIDRVSGVGSTLDDFLPRQQRGLIELDISPHTYAYERRLVDLFERYAPCEQDLTIYASYVKPSAGLTNPSATGTAVLKSKVRSWRADFARNILSLEVADNPINNVTLGYEITEAAHSGAPARSLGKTLPVVLGRGVEVVGYPLDTGTTPEFGLCANFGSDFETSQINTLKVQGADNEYHDVISGTVNSPSIEYTHSGSTTVVQPLVIAWSLDGLGWSSATPYLVTQIAIRICGVGAVPSGDFGLKVGLAPRDITTGAPNVAAGSSVTFYGQDYSSEFNVSSSTQSWIRLPLERPYILRGDATAHFLYIDGTDQLTGTGGGDRFEFRIATPTTSNSAEGWQVESAGGPWVGPFTGAIDTNPAFRLYGAEFNGGNGSGSTNERGFNYYQVTFEQTAVPSVPTQVENPDLSELKIIADIDGIEDDGSGTITGAASTLIEDVEDAVKLLTCEYDGTNWNVNSDLDLSTYSSELANLSVRGIATAGRTSGRASLTKTLQDLLYSCSARLGVTASGLTLCPMAESIESSGRIDDSKAQIIAIEELGADATLINKYVVNFDEKLSGNDFYSAANENDLKDYAGYLSRDSTLLGTLVENSETIYGIRELRDSRLKWAGTTTHANEVVTRYAQLYGRNPIWIVTFEVPFIEFQGLEVFQVYELVAPQLPAYFGTSSDAYPPTYDGDVVTEGKLTEKRAESYRVQIESKRLFVSNDRAPFLRCEARVILDDLDPT